MPNPITMFMRLIDGGNSSQKLAKADAWTGSVAAKSLNKKPSTASFSSARTLVAGEQRSFLKRISNIPLPGAPGSLKRNLVLAGAGVTGAAVTGLAVWGGVEISKANTEKNKRDDLVNNIKTFIGGREADLAGIQDHIDGINSGRLPNTKEFSLESWEEAANLTTGERDQAQDILDRLTNGSGTRKEREQAQADYKKLSDPWGMNKRQ